MKNEENEYFQRAGKRVLEFVAIQRRDCKEWAIPGVCNSIVRDSGGDVSMYFEGHLFIS
jgi:hypothetical protein